MLLRNLVVLQAVGARESFVPQISSAGWNVHVAHHEREARELISSHKPCVGLASIDNHNQFQPEKTDLWALCGDMEWIALVYPACLESTEFSQLIREFFFDYHTLPPDIDRLLFSLGHAYGMANLLNSVQRREDDNFSEYEMVGTSKVMHELFRNIRKVGSVDAPVLITGASGTGKELAARAIHERSHRSQGPFIAVNCGALPANLIQSELFGHEKGSFTGAHQRQIGYIESAAGGTLFLDEIGDLSLDLQSNLLRFLQENTIERIGGRKTIDVDVRIIAATHIDLEKAVDDAAFRDDLYYRLNVLHVKMPDLCEREEDIELLARFFFDKFSRDRRSQLKGFSEAALRAMMDHDWRGNVRELINRVRRAMVMSDKRVISPEDLGFEVAQGKRSAITLDEARAEAEKETIQHGLQRTHHNVSRAARDLGVSRVTLYRLMQKHHIAL